MPVIWGDFVQRAYGNVSVFAMNDIKKSKNISGEAYIQSSDTNLPGIIKTSQKFNLSIFWLVFIIPFWLVFIIPGELVLDDCIYASPERFLDFLWCNTIDNIRKPENYKNTKAGKLQKHSCHFNEFLVNLIVTVLLRRNLGAN